MLTILLNDISATWWQDILKEFIGSIPAFLTAIGALVASIVAAVRTQRNNKLEKIKNEHFISWEKNIVKNLLYDFMDRYPDWSSRYPQDKTKTIYEYLNAECKSHLDFIIDLEKDPKKLTSLKLWEKNLFKFLQNNIKTTKKERQLAIERLFTD